jgi:hypothetical protein
MSPGEITNLPGLLEELSGADAEHPDVAVQHESGLSLSVLRGWRLILEDLETDVDPRWAETADSGVVLRAMELVAHGEGDLNAVLDWRPGYGPPAG